jgi:hypothetical protein
MKRDAIGRDGLSAGFVHITEEAAFTRVLHARSGKDDRILDFIPVCAACYFDQYKRWNYGA